MQLALNADSDHVKFPKLPIQMVQSISKLIRVGNLMLMLFGD